MHAIILAGGYATRLYPLTIETPKPLILLSGTPMINYLIQKLDNLPEIDTIFVVTNEKFASHFEVWKQSYPSKKDIVIVNDGTTDVTNRLGSVGDISFVVEKYDIKDDVLILGGDNLFEDSLVELMQSFQTRGNTLALYDTRDLESTKKFNNLQEDSEGKIQDFTEKPENPTSTRIATLVYCLKNICLPHLSTVIESGKSDRAGDFIAHLCHHENLYGYDLKGKWFDIGSVSDLEAAETWIKERDAISCAISPE